MWLSNGFFGDQAHAGYKLKPERMRQPGFNPKRSELSEDRVSGMTLGLKVSHCHLLEKQKRKKGRQSKN
jgi:hypothetical protein